MFTKTTAGRPWRGACCCATLLPFPADAKAHAYAQSTKLPMMATPTRAVLISVQAQHAQIPKQDAQPLLQCQPPRSRPARS
jgi:hypothetical protein